MAYQTTLLKTVAECEELLNMAESDKFSLNYKIMGLQKNQTSVAGTATDVDEQLFAINTQIKSFEATLANASTTDAEKVAVRLVLDDLVNKRKSLVRKDKESTSSSILKRVCAINRAQREIDEIDAMIQEVTTYKATL